MQICFNPTQNLAKRKPCSNVCLHCGRWTLVWYSCFNWTKSVFLQQLSSVGRFMLSRPHLWGRGLFDRVKGSPSIRQCVLILAQGRFPIDYLMTQKHSTSPDRPNTHPAQSIMTICWYGILGSLLSKNLTDTFTTESRINCECLQQRANLTHCAVVIIVAWCWGWLEPSIPIPIHEELCWPANQQQCEADSLWGGWSSLISDPLIWSLCEWLEQPYLVCGGKKGESQKGNVKDSKCDQHGN